MRLLNFGGGGIAAAVVDYMKDWDHTVLNHFTCDVQDSFMVRHAMENLYAADWIFVTAGVSNPRSGGLEEIMTNLYGTLNVLRAARDNNLPCIVMGSIAGLQSKYEHVGYAASKAGVISAVRSIGSKAWCISPGRVDTAMRQRDYPDDPQGSRLPPEAIAWVVEDITRGEYAPGANIVVRKVGLGDRVDVYEEPRLLLPSLSA